MAGDSRDISQSFLTAKPGPMVVAVGGGKGGVGKSVVAANLAYALAQVGTRVTVVDADLGSANLHALFGIDRPVTTVQSFLEGHVAQLEDVVMATGLSRVALVPGSVGVAGAANLPHARKQKLLRHIGRLDADVVIVDCGAGIHFNVVDFFTHADIRLVVAMPQLVSLQNAYGFMKASAYRLLRQSGEGSEDAQAFDRATTSSETETVPQLLARIAATDVRLAGLLTERLRNMSLTLVGNQLENKAELAPIQALARMAHDFLSLDARVLCGIRRSDRIHGSVTRRRLFLEDDKTSVDAQAFDALAEAVLTHRKVTVPPPVAMPAC